MTVGTALLMAIIVMGPIKPGQVVLEKIYEIYGPPGGGHSGPPSRSPSMTVAAFSCSIR